MGLSVNTNVAALNAYRNLNATNNSLNKSLERLATPAAPAARPAPRPAPVPPARAVPTPRVPGRGRWITPDPVAARPA